MFLTSIKHQHFPELRTKKLAKCPTTKRTLYTNNFIHTNPISSHLYVPSRVTLIMVARWNLPKIRIGEVENPCYGNCSAHLVSIVHRLDLAHTQRATTSTTSHIKTQGWIYNGFSEIEGKLGFQQKKWYRNSWVN